MPNSRQSIKTFICYSLNDELYKNRIESLVIFEECLAQLGSLIKQKCGQDVFDSIIRHFLNEKQINELTQKILVSNNRKARV